MQMVGNVFMTKDVVQFLQFVTLHIILFIFVCLIWFYGYACRANASRIHFFHPESLPRFHC